GIRHFPRAKFGFVQKGHQGKIRFSPGQNAASPLPTKVPLRYGPDGKFHFLSQLFIFGTNCQLPQMRESYLLLRSSMSIIILNKSTQSVAGDYFQKLRSEERRVGK